VHRQSTINLDDGLLLPRAEIETMYADFDKSLTTVVYRRRNEGRKILAITSPKDSCSVE
jgi:hypothetical protein